MEKSGMSKKEIIFAVIIIAVLIVALIGAFIILKQRKGEQASNPVPVVFVNYGSILNGNVQDYVVTLNDKGFITIDLESSDYLLHYTLEQCTNPSENLDYSYTNSEGVEISYDPLKEKIVTDSEGNSQKMALSEAGKENALITEKIYVIGTEGTEPEKELAIFKAGVTEFSADGNVKFLFDSKCDDASITLKLYRI